MSDIYMAQFFLQLLQLASRDHEQSRFLVLEALQKFRDFGGVRIEDQILITETGIENFTHVPRT